MKITLLTCIKKDDKIIERWTTLNWKIPPFTHEGHIEFIKHIKMSCENTTPSCIKNNLYMLQKYYYDYKISHYNYFYYKLWQRQSFDMCILNDGKTYYYYNWPYTDDMLLTGIDYHFCDMTYTAERNWYFLLTKGVNATVEKQRCIAYTYNEELQENIAFTKNEMKYLLKFSAHYRDQIQVYFKNIHQMLEWLQSNAAYNPREDWDAFDYQQAHISDKTIYDFYSRYPKENIHEFLLIHYLMFCRVILPLYYLGLTFKLDEKTDLFDNPFTYANTNKQNIFKTAEDMYHELINEYYVET